MLGSSEVEGKSVWGLWTEVEERERVLAGEGGPICDKKEGLWGGR